MSKGVYVVTGLELGWDCVVAVFDADSVSEEELEESFDSEYYVIHYNNIVTNLESFS